MIYSTDYPIGPWTKLHFTLKHKRPDISIPSPIYPKIQQHIRTPHMTLAELPLCDWCPYALMQTQYHTLVTRPFVYHKVQSKHSQEYAAT